MIILSLARLRSFCNDLLIEAGASEENAITVANHLSLSNLLGHDSHGVSCISMYLDAISDGYIQPASEPKRTQRYGQHRRREWKLDLRPGGGRVRRKASDRKSKTT